MPHNSPNTNLEDFANPNTLIDATDLFDKAFSWEPKYTNRFIMYMGNTGIPAYLVKAAGRPSITNGSVITNHINVDRKLKGKSTWNATVTFSRPQPVVQFVRL